MAVQDRFSVRNLYLYLVCLITLVIGIFALVQLVRGVVELAWPDPGFWEFPAEEGLDPEEQAQREQRAQDSQQRQAVLGLVSSTVTLLITAPLYVYHWRKVQAELPSRRQDDVASPPA
jgi:hypothetical protein